MCGRITRTSPREAIAKEFGVTRFMEVDWHPRYRRRPEPDRRGDHLGRIDGMRSAGRTDALGVVSPTAKEAEALAPRSMPRTVAEGASSHRDQRGIGTPRLESLLTTYFF